MMGRGRSLRGSCKVTGYAPGFRPVWWLAVHGFLLLGWIAAPAVVQGAGAHTDGTHVLKASVDVTQDHGDLRLVEQEVGENGLHGDRNAGMPEPPEEAVPGVGVPGEAGSEAVRVAGEGGDTGVEEDAAPLVLNSSTLSLDGALWQATAAGDVKISYEGTTLEADEVLLDIERGESFARGSVRLMHGQDILTCDSLSFQWETQVGFVENADLLVENTGYRIQAGFMEKTGPDTYAAENCSFTTCRCPEDSRWLPWEVEAGNAEVTLGGYAKVRRARFRLFHVPVLYVPVGVLPVKLDRESGFLVPQVNQSGTRGWGLGIPYFWAIDASWDATFLLEGYTKRGPKPNVELRYRPTARTGGTWNASGYYDFKMDQGRYGVRGRHLQELSGSFYNKLNVNLVSDDTYIEDFPWEVGSTADRLLESQGVFGFRRDDLHAAAVVRYSQLVDGMAGGPQLAQKAPEIAAHFFQRPFLWPWLFLSLDATATNYVNENGEDRVRGQVFPEARVAFQPIPGLNLSGYGGVREVLSWGDMAYYTLDGNGPGVSTEGTRHRTLVETGADVDARLGRAFSWGNRRLFHTVQPGIGYQYVRLLTGDPFPVEMDGLDTLARRNWLTATLRTSLWGSGPDAGDPGHMLAEMRLVQGLTLERSMRHGPEERWFSDTRVELQVNPRPYLSFHLTAQVDPYAPDLRFLEADVDLWDRKRKYGLNVGFIRHNEYEVNPLTRVELVDVYDRDYGFGGIDDTVRARVTVKPFAWLTAVWNTLYLIDASGKVENHLSLQYVSRCKCWSVIARVRQTVRPDDVGFSVQVRLDGLGTF